MPVAQSNRSITFSGYSFAEQTPQVSAEHLAVWEVPVAANSALNSGTLTTRTGNDEGVATLQANHTIVTSGALVDVYWTGGSRYGMTATKDVNAITIAGGAGDNLPDQDTAVILCAQIPIDPVAIVGDKLEWLGVVYSNPLDTGAKGSLDIHDSGGSEKQWDLVHYSTLGGCDNVHNVDGGDANPIAGDTITDGFVSHDSTLAGTLYILALIDPTA